MNKKVIATIVLLVFLVSILPLTLAREIREPSQGNDDGQDDNSDGIDDDAAEDDDAVEIVALSDDEEVGTPPSPPKMQEQLQKLKEIRDKQMENLRERVQNREELMAGLTSEEKTKFAALGRARIEKMLEENGNLKEALADFKLERMNARLKFRERVIGATDLEAAKAKYQEAADKYQEAKKQYIDTRNQFKELKDKEAKCKDSDTEECQQIKEQAIEKAKEHLLKVSDMVLETIAKVRSKIQESEDITAEEETAMLEKLDTLEQQVEDLKAEIEAATTKEDVKALGKELVDLWKDANFKLRKDQGRLFNGRMMRIINNADHLEAKLDQVLARLEAKNITVTDLEDKVDEFSSKVDQARVLYKEGRDLLADAINSTDETAGVETIKQAQAKFKEAHALLQEAHKILQELTRMINENGESLDEDDSGDEVVVEDIPALPVDDDVTDVNSKDDGTAPVTE